MPSRNTLLRISKFLGKAIFVLLLVLLAIIALIHLPPVQRQITHLLSNYLSARIRSRVEISRIGFSILGNAEIEHLMVWDANNENIFSARKIEVTSNILNLAAGDFIFDEIHIAGLNSQLIQSQEGLNIQYILDAFKPINKHVHKSKKVKLQFNSILLENILVDYTSAVNGLTFTANLGTFTSQGAGLTLKPNKISANKVYLQNTVVNVLSTRQLDATKTFPTSKQKRFLSPDFGTGIVFEIMDIELKDNDFYFHVNREMNTTKFDPSHLDIKDIQLRLSDILIREDTLAAVLQSLSAQLPGSRLSDARAHIHLNRNRLGLSNLYFTSDKSELKADIAGWYYLPSAKDDGHSNLQISALARIDPVNLSYFLSESVMNHFNHWGIIELGLDGTRTMGKYTIKALNLKTGNSHLHAAGIVHDGLGRENLYWKDFMIHASIGSDFKRTLLPLFRGIKVPPDVKLNLKSSGNPKKIYVDGNVSTKWGDVKATGLASLNSGDFKIDMNLRTENVDLGQFTNLHWLGPMNLSLDAKGIIGKAPDIEIKGLIDSIEIQGQPVHKIAFQTRVIKSNATGSISIADTEYRSDITADISFGVPLMVTTGVQLSDFNLGSLLRLDSALSMSGDLNAKIKIDKFSVEGFLGGKSILIQNSSIAYLQDSIAVDLSISPKASRFNYSTDDGNGNLSANFDIRDSPSVMQTWSANFLNSTDRAIRPPGNRAINFKFLFEKAQPFRLFGMNVDDFSSVSVTGKFDEQKQAARLQAASGNFKGYGVSLDSLNTDVMILRDSVTTDMNVTNLSYNSIRLGNLDFDMHTEGDTAMTNLFLSGDSISILGFAARILRSDGGVLVYPDKLLAFDNDYFIDRKNPVHLKKRNIILDHFLITRDDMQISLDGDLKAFDLNLANVDLTRLNHLLSPDSAIINYGQLNARISYLYDQRIDLRANIDSLSLYDSNPLTLEMKAVRDKTHVPFEFLLNNASNKIDINGQYLLENSELDARLLADVQDLEIFKFLVSGIVDEMNGTVKGKAKIRGPIQNPRVNGSLRFIDAGFTTSNPKFRFKVEDDSIVLDNGAISLNNFRVFDPEHNPLLISGHVTSPDYRSINYDLQLQTEKFTLINNPDSAKRRLTGLLVMGSDLKLTGNDKDINLKANITIQDTTALTVTASNDDIQLLNSEAVLDFIDPLSSLDSTGPQQSGHFYDSLIASLPDFNLNSTITIEENAGIRVNIDAQSGDFIEASGGGTLELGYDRTGNVRLSGNYSIKEGVYRVTFYGLAGKDFNLVPGSSINWSGIPENGNLDIKAVYTIRTSSIGLIGNEVSENEKSIYKRALPYDVGIDIKGTIESPLISFSLDLPEEEKVNYPVLANKLERLTQPEFQSELNKQVFGVLVLGGFIPETSGTDINQNQIATTALSNSVNGLLSTQLNRFASQYIKSVEIDVGIQSYSDYAASGGKTETAMDFRVTKRVMDDRLSFEIGGDFSLNQEQSGTNTGDNFRGDIAIIYDLTEQRSKKLKLFNNETYDIIYQEIRNTGISLIFIREFDRDRKHKRRVND